MANLKTPIIYSADWCGYCLVLKTFLDSKGVKYEVKDVDRPEVRTEMTKLTNGNQTIPTMFIGDEFWVNPGRDLAHLNQILAEQLL